MVISKLHLTSQNSLKQSNRSKRTYDNQNSEIKRLSWVFFISKNYTIDQWVNSVLNISTV